MPSPRCQSRYSSSTLRYCAHRCVALAIGVSATCSGLLPVQPEDRCEAAVAWALAESLLSGRALWVRDIFTHAAAVAAAAMDALAGTEIEPVVLAFKLTRVWEPLRLGFRVDGFGTFAAVSPTGHRRTVAAAAAAPGSDLEEER